MSRTDYINQYKRVNYKRITVEVKKDYYTDKLKPAADSAGESVSGYIKKAIDERLKNDKS